MKFEITYTRTLSLSEVVEFDTEEEAEVYAAKRANKLNNDDFATIDITDFEIEAGE